jgi:hypothetical protein
MAQAGYQVLAADPPRRRALRRLIRQNGNNHDARIHVKRMLVPLATVNKCQNPTAARHALVDKAYVSSLRVPLH